MMILWGLVGAAAACLVIALVVWGILLLDRRGSQTPTVPVTRQDESNKAKGKLGKTAVKLRLSTELSGTDYQTFSNVRVPTPKSSRMTKIDHVVVSRFGVFAIETKTWPGLISCTKDPRIWKQQIGRSINEHDSPVEHNARQVQALARYLDLRPSYVHGFVCFSAPNTRFGEELPANVLHASELATSILRHQKVVVNHEGVTQMAGALRALS